MTQPSRSAVLKMPDVEIILDDIPEGILRSIAENGSIGLAIETARKYSSTMIRVRKAPVLEPWMYADPEFHGDNCYIASLESIRNAAIARYVWAEHVAEAPVEAISHKYQLSPRRVMDILARHRRKFAITPATS